MTRFSAEWLSLREPYDRAARDPSILGAVADAFQGATSIRVVDLACGTGATLRALEARLPRRQNWQLVDNDLGLLGRASMLGQPPDLNVVTTPLDLVRDLELVLDGALDLVTTSALFDLVSLEWLDRLAVEAAARRVPVYAALTYDGRTVIEPSDPFDAAMLAQVDAHQRTDKGFGPALGASAAARSIERFESVGYNVLNGQSDWLIGPNDRAIQETIFAGWSQIASASESVARDLVTGWLTRRRAYVTQGRSTLRVGHVDIFARPIASR
jgi:hypothetical protein